MNIYQKHGNIEILGNVKVNNITLTNSELQQLITDNIQWKRYISYSQGQICSKKSDDENTNATSFYYSTISNNLNNNPNNTDVWKPIQFESSKRNLLFKIPKFPQNSHYELCIDFSINNSFTDIYSINSYDNYNLFYISTNDDFSILNENITFNNYDENKVLLLDTQNISNTYIFFRYYWFERANNVKSKYYFGTINSILQSFDNASQSNNIELVINDQNIDGNGSLLRPISLKKNLNINSITTNSTFSIITDNSNILLNSSNGNNELLIKACNLKYNGNDQNTANGIVILNEYGKIPNSLTVNNQDRLLPVKTNVQQSSYGNPLVITSKTITLENVSENDDATVLLIQNSSINNIALSENLVTISNNIQITDNQLHWFRGGIILNYNSTFNNVLQFSIQIDKTDLTRNYKSIVQHFLSDDLIFASLKCNERYLVFQYGLQQYSYDILALDYVVKIIIQYNQHNIKVYANGNLAFSIDLAINPLSVNFDLYIGTSITDYSKNEIDLLGFDGKWRLLKIDNRLKSNQIYKNIGEQFTTQIKDSQYNQITVNYNWEYSNDTEGSYLFGKKGNKPYLFPFPNAQNTMPIATRNSLGGIIIGSGFYVDKNGVISVAGGNGDIDLSYYIQSNNDINSNGDIQIRSKVLDASTLRLVSSNPQGINNYGGQLFLGGSQNKKISLTWKTNKNIGFYAYQNASKTIVSICNATDIEDNNSTKINLQLDGSVNIDSYTGQLYFNGNQLNTANGLVQLNQFGKINSDLLPVFSDSSNYASNSLVIYDSNDIRTEHIGLKAGNGITFEYQGSNDQIVVIHNNEQGQLRQDIYIGNNDLVNNKYTVLNVKLGGFVIQDDDGYLIYPAQRYNNNLNCVEIDFNDWNIPNGKYFKIRFVRGYKGDNGQITQDQAMNMILSWLY